MDNGYNISGLTRLLKVVFRRHFCSSMCSSACFLLMLAGIMPQILSAQTDKTAYAAGSYEYAGITLPFRRLDLNQEKAGKSLLVIQLHGGTARGTDNQAQLDASAVDSVEIFLRSHQMKAVFLLPQCASDRVWNESVKSQATPMTEVLSHWLEEFVNTSDIDLKRIYITGYSAGGSGAWRMLSDNTSFFAAACIAAANPLMVQAEKVCHTPVFAIAGGDDNIMDATMIESFVNSLVALDGEACFDLLQDRNHLGTCNEAFTRSRLAWMFSHRRNTAVGTSLPLTAQRADDIRIYALDGRFLGTDVSVLQPGVFIINNRLSYLLPQ